MPADPPRLGRHELARATSGPPSAPETPVIEAERRLPEEPPPADEAAALAVPDKESQAATAPEPQALPAGPPAPPISRAAPAVRGDHPAQARAAEGPPINAIRRRLDHYVTELAPREYVGAVRDLDVQVHVLSIREDGDRSVVRFTRRDRYRDAAGRLVLRETPPIETVVVKTTEGVRFETPPA